MHLAGIIIKRKDERAAEIASGLLDWFEGHGWGALYEEESQDQINKPGATSKADMVARCDLLVVLGGDGTLLAAARALGGKPTPVLGCNLGNLGFLTETSVDELESTLETYLEGRCALSHRMMLEGVHRRTGNGTEERFTVLNDVVVAKGALARILDMEVSVDGNLVHQYKADGLIIATPTGSTAYSLAANGPLVHPDLQSILLTPLASHSLTARSIAIPPDGRVHVKVTTSNAEAFLTLDGQQGRAFEVGDELVVSRSGHELLLVRSPLRTFYDISRTKLKWGER